VTSKKTKTPALSTQLKAAQAQIAELTKKAEREESYRKNAEDKTREYLAELNNVHALLDAMPNPPPRVAEQTNSWGGKSEGPVPASVRVSVLLATR
jgi:hypothetical protein